jgi:hypothetical protein
VMISRTPAEAQRRRQEPSRERPAGAADSLAADRASADPAAGVRVGIGSTMTGRGSGKGERTGEVHCDAILPHRPGKLRGNLRKPSGKISRFSFQFSRAYCGSVAVGLRHA